MVSGKVKMKRRGFKIVLSSPSGGGKTTLAGILLKKDKNLVRSISCTTRKIRPGEKNGKDYFFVSPADFRARVGKKGFLEWAKVHDQYYGTPKRWVDQQLYKGKDVLFVIDVQGGAALKRQDPRTVLIFVNPPSMKVLRQRLEKRQNNSPSDLVIRLKNAKGEMRRGRLYDYWVVNDRVPRVVAEIRRILRAIRLSQAPPPYAKKAKSQAK
jgi:guanylate kinase